MATVRCPVGLAAGGKALWKAVNELDELDAVQLVQLEEACRAKDRLDKLDCLLRGEVDAWARVFQTDVELVLKIDGALDKANTTANLMKQLLAALRLPDEQTGKRPIRRPPRGAQKPTIPGGKSNVSSLDRARARAGA
jgi:hypothetical protein